MNFDKQELSAQLKILVTQQPFICSNSTSETLEKDVEQVRS